MTLGEYLRVGETITLGSHTFTAEEIKAFARKYDPQPFHVDEEAARSSVFGKLCASGWHTAAMWMRYNMLTSDGRSGREWTGKGPRPEFGPSPGFTNMKWLKPVYAGETITFKRSPQKFRALMNRPGWVMLAALAEAFDSTGDKVMEFESAVLVKAETGPGE